MAGPCFSEIQCQVTVLFRTCQYENAQMYHTCNPRLRFAWPDQLKSCMFILVHACSWDDSTIQSDTPPSTTPNGMSDHLWLCFWLWQPSASLCTACHDDVVKIIECACEHNVCLIPCGGNASQAIWKRLIELFMSSLVCSLPCTAPNGLDLANASLPFLLLVSLFVARLSLLCCPGQLCDTFCFF